MKIAVTGTSGHVGNNLCRMLIEQGHEVRALVHRNTQ
ncbi:MAG: dependent epimerase/dehydratase family, partial [Bacteroidetes bacterium]|nr:dependent epimerase/dehydratase family [Bacteroidota bacterium]